MWPVEKHGFSPVLHLCDVFTMKGWNSAIMNTAHASIISIGTAVPENVVTNNDLEKLVDTSDEWIMQRTGIKTRYITSKENSLEACSDIGSKAILRALEKTKLKPSDIDTVICSTFTPDYFYPSTACTISAKIGARGAFAFDVEAACSGFIYGLTIANALITAGQSKIVAVVGSDIISRLIDWTDRSTCVLFGDGAGAAIVTRSEDPRKGILASKMASDGTLKDILKCQAWDGKNQMMMRGNEVFKYAVRYMIDITNQSLTSCGLTSNDVDYFVPHQANMRIIQAVGEGLKLPSEKVISNLVRYGNTSAASIPLAFDDIWSAGKVGDGTIVVFTALGAGVTYGSMVVRF